MWTTLVIFDIINSFFYIKNMDQYDRQLNAKNIKPTAMRLLVLRFLHSKVNAVTLADIEQSFDQSDRVTIYRTIKTFESKGLVHKILTDNITRYALCSEHCDEQAHQDTHLHFECSVCNQTTCLTNVNLPPLKLPDGFLLSEIQIMGKGICALCRI